MKFFTGWIIAAGLGVTTLAVTTMGVHAQVLSPQVLSPQVLSRQVLSPQVLSTYDGTTAPYITVSDFGGPYAAMPQDAPVPRYGPTLLPPREVYTIVRESGFSPLGIPQQRGLFYTISVIDKGGDDGRLVIDGRNGRIIRFMPAYRMGDNFNEEINGAYGSAGSPSPMGSVRSGAPRPPTSVPRLASRAPPLPKPSPLTARPAPEASQQSAAVQAKPEPQAAPPAAAPPVVAAKPDAEAKPAAPEIAPTQEMPGVQGLE